MVNVGDVVEGKVTGITSFGAFIQLEDGSMGLVHISEVAEGYVKDIKDYLSEGQTVTVKAISLEKDGKLRLSIKKLAPEKSVEKTYSQGARGFDNQKRSFQNSRGIDNKSGAPQSITFEDKLTKFMKESDEKIGEVKRQTDNKRGGGYGKKASQF